MGLLLNICSYDHHSWVNARTGMCINSNVTLFIYISFGVELKFVLSGKPLEHIELIIISCWMPALKVSHSLREKPLHSSLGSKGSFTNASHTG